MRRIGIVAIALLVLLLGSQVNAQSTLTYGDRILGEVSAEQSQAIFSFSGEEGERVTASVIGISAGMTPTLAINAPSGQQLAFTNQSTSGLADAQVTLVLPEDGTYNVQVGAPADGQGEFLLLLDGAPMGDYEPIEDSLEVELDGEEAQTFTIAGDPDVPLPVLIVPLDDALFTAQLIDADGMVLAMINGVVAQIELPLSEEEFTLMLDAPEAATVQISLRSAISTGDAQTVEATPESPYSCRASSGGTVNVRSGPGTEFEIRGAMRNNTLVEALTDNGWVQITFQGEPGYVLREIVTLGGNCNFLDTVEGAEATAEVESTEAVEVTAEVEVTEEVVTETPAPIQRPTETPEPTATP